MSNEIIESFSGADQVLSGLPVGREQIKQEIGPCGYPHGPSVRVLFAENTVSLSEHFQKVVLNHTKWAWYVDYFTTDPSMYNVYYFATEPLIRWTNENIADRDPENRFDSCWQPDDVATWFREDGGEVAYEHVLKFHSDNVGHELRVSAYSVLLDDENRWDEYVEFGIRGAMGQFGEARAFNHLDSIEVRRA